MGRLVIDGNSVYEIDEECVRKKEEKERQKLRNKESSYKELREKNG